MRSTVKRADTAARQAGTIDFADTADRVDGFIHLLTRKPVTPWSMSWHRSRLEAMKGVPLASASTTERPNGSSKLMRWSSARAEPRVRSAHPPGRDNYGPFVERWPNVFSVIVLILDNASHHQPPAHWRAAAMASAAPVGMDAAEEQQTFAAVRLEGEVLEPDAMVDGRCIVQVRWRSASLIAT